jgi:predicted ABC-type transport system involved in lysophospholipase L1 biosynthesis ATPase subunit
MSLLEIKNLNVRFGDKNAVPVVDGLDLKVDKGEVLAIVGESGFGQVRDHDGADGPDRASRDRHRRLAELRRQETCSS